MKSYSITFELYNLYGIILCNFVYNAIIEIKCYKGGDGSSERAAIVHIIIGSGIALLKEKGKDN